MEQKYFMNKTTTQTVKEELQAIDIIAGYVAVRRKVYVNDEVVSESEYITTAQKVQETPVIISQSPSVDFNDMPVLYDKGINEALRTTPYYDVDFSAFEKNNPFTALQEKALTEYELLFRKDSNYMVMDLDGEALPNAVRFDGINSGLTSEFYNLRKVGYILKHRNDIRFVDMDDECDNIFVTVMPKDFFVAGNKNKMIETIAPFVWTPAKKEDWKNYMAFCAEASSLDGIKREYVDDKAFILSNILGLDIARKEY